MPTARSTSLAQHIAHQLPKERQGVPKRDDRHSKPEADLIGNQLDGVVLWTLHRLDHCAFGHVDVDTSKVLLGGRPVFERKVFFVKILFLFAAIDILQKCTVIEFVASDGSAFVSLTRPLGETVGNVVDDFLAR